MSRHSLCGPCFVGDHASHDGSHRGIPGVLGGERCMCGGDCFEQAAVRFEAFMRPFQTDDPAATTDRNARAGIENGESV